MNDTATQRITWLSLLFLAVFVSPVMADKGRQTLSDSSRGVQERFTPWEYPQNDIRSNTRHESIKLADKGGDSRGKYSNANHHKRYEQLTPEQRDKLRKRRDDFKSLPPEERERIHKARAKFRKMPPEQRKELKEKWRNMSPEERQRAHKKKGKGRHD